MEKECVSKKSPTRTRISDKELAEKIRRDRAERPSEFVSASYGSTDSTSSYYMSSVNEVIAKWL